MRLLLATVALGAALGVAARAPAQQSALTRAQAIQAALEHGPRIGVAAADTAVASAQLLTARLYPDPSLTASYSKSYPQQHVSIDVPLDLPALRAPRVQSAQLELDAARLRYRLARVTIALDADTSYTRAIAARERLALSHRNALDGDSLLHMVERRRDAGDASDMDVELARVNAGQQHNAAAADSLTFISTLLDLQATLGIGSDHLEIAAVDSLGAPPEALPPAETTLGEGAASLTVDAASAALRLQRRSLFATPSFSLGLEHGDPSQPGILPTFGLGISIPIFDRHRGAIQLAEAEQFRAVAELALTRVETRSQVAHAARERENALARVARDRQLVTSADRVATMSLTAYREGAASLANVLEAQRSVRDVLAQYVDDLAAAWISTAELSALSITPTTRVP
jgi:outer membrane protein, heavy metal efflux system